MAGTGKKLKYESDAGAGTGLDSRRWLGYSANTSEQETRLRLLSVLAPAATRPNLCLSLGRTAMMDPHQTMTSRDIAWNAPQRLRLPRPWLSIRSCPNWPRRAQLCVSQDKHPLLATPHATPPLQTRMLLSPPTTQPHAMIAGASATPSRPQHRAEQRRITTALYASPMMSGIGVTHFHGRRLSVACKPDVQCLPTRAYTTLQHPISRSLAWTPTIGLRVQAGPPPVKRGKHE